jgi:hypothetical protein
VFSRCFSSGWAPAAVPAAQRPPGQERDAGLPRPAPRPPAPRLPSVTKCRAAALGDRPNVSEHSSDLNKRQFHAEFPTYHLLHVLARPQLAEIELHLQWIAAANKGENLCPLFNTQRCGTSSSDTPTARPISASGVSSPDPAARPGRFHDHWLFTALFVGNSP